MIMKSNLYVYFYTYFSADIIFVYTRNYLPIYFSNVIKIDTTPLSFVLFFSYLALLSRPLISLYFDRKNSKRKLVVLLSGLAILVNFSLLLCSLHSILLFGIIYTIVLASISINTVGVNKIMISNSLDMKSKNTNALLIQFGSITGSLFSIFIFLISVSSLSNWANFFILGILSTTPLLLFTILLKDKREDYPSNQEKRNKNSINKKPVILFALFLFLAFSDKLFSYSINPWISVQTSTAFFSMLWFVLILIYTFGNIIGGRFFKNNDCRLILLITTLIIGLILFTVPFLSFSIFLIFYGLYFFFSGVSLIKIISYKMELAQNRVFNYQMMTMFSIMATIVFTPLGTFLYKFVETDIIISISGILIVLSVIPFYFVKLNKKEGY